MPANKEPRKARLAYLECLHPSNGFGLWWYYFEEALEGLEAESKLIFMPTAPGRGPSFLDTAGQASSRSPFNLLSPRTGKGRVRDRRCKERFNPY